MLAPDDAYLRILAAGNLPASRVIVAIAGVAGVWRIVRDSESWELPLRQRVGVILSVFLGGLVGAAIPAFLAGGWIRALATQQVLGPKSILGALACGFFGAAIYKKWVVRIPLDTSDAFAPGTALMMAIGRLGCFVNHCCFGIEWSGPLGMDFGDGVARLPVQLVEAACTFALFALFAWLHRTNRWPHRRLFLFLGAYAIERFTLEFLRAPISAVVVGLNAYQWFSVGLLALAVFQIARRTRKYVPRSVPVGSA